MLSTIRVISYRAGHIVKYHLVILRREYLHQRLLTILQVAIGLVVALDYKNPYLNPYEEYQAWRLLQTIFTYFW